MTSFTPDTLFHLDDPDTSRTAAINLDGTATEQVCHAIIDLLDERGALAAWELERVYFDIRTRRGWPVVAFYSIHRRCSQMKKQIGVLRGTGTRTNPPGGKAAEVLGLSMHPTQAHATVTRHFTKGD